MKRKFKLITSIASLTVAIALLMFGVYAAGLDRVVEVDGNVAFTASNIKATVQVYERIVTASTVPETGEGEDVFVPFNLIATLVYDTNGSVTVTDAGEGVVTAGEDNVTAQDLQNVSLGATDQLNDTSLVYQYRVVITNDFSAGGSSINFTMVDKYDPEGTEVGANNWIATTGSVIPDDGTLVANTGTVTFTFSYVVVPEYAPQNGDFDIGATFTMNRDNA